LKTPRPQNLKNPVEVTLFQREALSQIKTLRQNLPLEGAEPKFDKWGKVTRMVGTIMEANLTGVPLGARVRIFDRSSDLQIDGEVVGFMGDKAQIMPFSDPTGICVNAHVACIEREPRIRVGDHLIGRIVDPYLQPFLGDPIPSTAGHPWAIGREPLNPLTRRRIRKTFDLGVKSLNALLTCGEGQRVGIMAGSGVGKSVLMGMIARYSEADLNVIALIGERGREVLEFLEENLGEEGLKRSIVVVSTSDQSHMSKVRAANVATAIAEHYRETGKSVLLMMDSLTRVANAQREIGLARGEPPTTKGYTPSVFSLLPRLLERAGNSSTQGSITGIYTVLVDGDDFNDPICDAARSILDGHVNLSRRLASKNQFPAVEILTSASRVMLDIVDESHKEAAALIREMMAEYEKNEDLINIGGYAHGSNPKIDRALILYPKIIAFLKQGREEHTSFEETKRMLLELTQIAVQERE
jgi:flagellum-specific ATP synthase